MSSQLVGVIGVVVFLVLVSAGVWVGFAAATVGLIGIIIFKGLGGVGGIAGVVPYTSVASFDLSVIPMFIIMGYFAHYGGVTRNLFFTGRQWFGHYPGGLAIGTIFGAAAFGACSGSSTAAAAVFGKVAIPEMRRYHYSSKLAAGVVASAGTLAIMIPPSINMVIYGVITEQSIGRLLIGGILPGILEAVLFSATVYIWCRMDPSLGAALPPVSWKERLASLKGSWAMLLLAAVVIGGIYSGIFTPTEAGGIAAIAALLIALFSRQITWYDFKQSLLETGKTTAMIFLTLIGILIFLRFLALSGALKTFISTMVGLPLPPLGVLGIMVFIYFILGMFISVIGMMMLTLPIFFPIIVQLGYDPIWFGVIVVMMSEVAFITPPVALNIYVVKATAPDVPTEDIVKGVLPFLVIMLVIVGILIAFPQIVTWLPSTMMRR